MKQVRWLALLLATSWQLSSCSHAQPELPINSKEAAPAALLDAAAPAAAGADTPAEEVAPPAPPPPPASPVAPIPAAPASRLLIYHADVQLKTEAMPRASARLDSLVRHSGGFVTAATETHADGEWRQQLTLRIPPTRFEALLGGLGGLGTVEEKKLSTDDVTAEHADVAARLAAKRAIERQYTVLLGRAQRINDVLAIEEKLGEVRADIEGTESRLKALNDEVAYSTITLTLYQPLPQAVPDAPIVSLGSRLVESFYNGWQLLVGLLLGAVALWPLALLGAAGTWLWLRRRARRGRVAATA